MSSKNGQFYEFDGFRLDAGNPGLWRGGELVPLSPKALELLALLVCRRGEIVSREELLEAVWPGTFVEEANINYTVSLLRKVLDSRDKNAFIQTVPKRGYRFVAEVREISPNGTGEKQSRDSETFEPPASTAAAGAEPTKTPVRWHFVAIVLLGVLLLSSFAVWWRATDRAVPVTERNIRTAAILPFKNLNEGEQNKELSLGLTDSLISRLGSLNRFTVRPFDAVEKHAASESDALKLGEKLKVDVVLEGTFQTVGNRLRVSARLWDVRDGAQIWAGTFDETETDVFVLQDKISAGVVESIAAELSPIDRQILKKRLTENAEALRAYARGREIHDRRPPGWFEKAVAEYQKAVEHDPAYALAYTGFADAFAARGNLLSGAESGVFYEKARQYAEKAVALDAESAESHTALGGILLNRDWDWAGAERHFRRAVELNPNYSRAHQRYAQLLSILGRHDEALAVITRAGEINPLSQAILMAHFPILESRGDHARALQMAEDFYRFDPNNSFARIAYATFLYHRGEFARVVELGEESVVKEQKFGKGDSIVHKWLTLLSAAHRKTGQDAKADKLLAGLERAAADDTKALYSLAMNYAEMGRGDAALSALEKCLNRREERMPWVGNEPRFASLKSEPRFREILRKMNLGD